MPSLYALKPAFQGLLRPAVRRLAGWGVSANQVTVAAALLSALVGAAVALRGAAALPLVPLALLVRMALNAVDGMLAREHHMASRLGALLNELGDAASDLALYLPMALLPGLPAPLVVLAAVGGLLAELAGVLGPAIGATRRYEGPMGKSDRALAFSLVAGVGWASSGAGVGWASSGGAASSGPLTPGTAAPWSLMPGAAASWLLGAVVLLSAWTVVNRVRAALREASPS